MSRPSWVRPASRPHRPPVNDPLNPLEAVEQRRVADYLRARGDLVWVHAPNESRRSARQGRALKEAGMQRGVPDVLIFTPVFRAGIAAPYVGLAIELKRLHGGRLEPEQSVWRDWLRECGWYWEMCRGADAAIAVIEECYGPPQAARRVA